MNANELRIGNWVQINPPGNHQSGICMVEVIKRSSIYLHCESDDYFVTDVPFEKIKPIPLAPEILEKCGFQKDKGWYMKFAKMIPGKNCYLISCEDNEYGFDLEDATELRYLHQLQNLYFALTGEELQVNL